MGKIKTNGKAISEMIVTIGAELDVNGQNNPTNVAHADFKRIDALSQADKGDHALILVDSPWKFEALDP